MQTPPRIPAAAAPLISGVVLASCARSAEAERKISGEPIKSRFMARLISGFARRVSTEFPSFFTRKDSPRPGLVLRHAFGDSLQHREPAKKQNPNKPARNGDVSDNETRHRETVTFQFRVRLDSRQGEVAANHSTDRRDQEQAATESAQTEDAED